MERNNIVTPVNVGVDRGMPPLPTALDAEFGRTVTIDVYRGSWTETYCHKDTKGKCNCEPHQPRDRSPIMIDDPKCREKIKEAGLKNNLHV